MFVRLGFSVAAHLEPDLLLVDEVLAVGDADFRARCMQRMWEMVNSGNVAIVFVSHHMQSVDGLCNEIILLDHGRPHRGSKEELIAHYLGDDVSRRHVRIPPQDRDRLIETWNKNETTTGDIQIKNVQLFDEVGQEKNTFRSDEKLIVRLNVESQKRIDGVVSSISLKDPCGLVIAIERSNYRGHEPFTIDGKHTIEVVFESLQLKAGSYVLGAAFHDKTLQSKHCIATVETIHVMDSMPNPGGKEGFFIPKLRWEINKRD
jgi:ABC-type sulfate/molybdate transport systems ATPase subunit